jgi:predicted dehydrogenase
VQDPVRESAITRRQFVGAGAGLAVVRVAMAAAPQASSDRKIRIGVVGGGFGTQFQWHQHPNCVVEAVSDLQTPRRELLMKVYQCAKSYESLEKLIQDDKIEAVAVFTDAPSHDRHVVACMKHGKHVISAVPAATSLDDCHAILETKKQTGLKYMMAETSYYRPPVIGARNLYRDGQKLLYTEGQYYHNNVTLLPSFNGWRYAMPPMLYPTHATAFYVGVTGKRLTSASCVGWRGQGGQWAHNKWDNNPFASESALFATSEQTMCRINVFWICAADGETGSWIWRTPPTQKALEKVEIPPGMDYGGHGGSHGPLTHEFICALVEDREPAVNVHEALAMTAPGIVAHQSALKGGERLIVPSFG